MFDPESDQFTYSEILHRVQLKKTKAVRCTAFSDLVSLQTEG